MPIEQLHNYAFTVMGEEYVPSGCGRRHRHHDIGRDVLGRVITVLSACELNAVETGVDLEFRAGSSHPQRVIHALGKPVASRETKGLQMLVTLQDITGRRQAEEALRESEERFQQIITAGSADSDQRSSPVPAET